MTREEAKQIFLNRGIVDVEGGSIFDGDKWRKACRVISEWLEQEPCEDTVKKMFASGLLKDCEMCKAMQEPCEDAVIDKNYWKGFNNGIRTEKFRESKRQQPCEDVISRQAVFETIDDCNSDGLKGIFCSYDDGERFKKYIKNLPPVTPTQGWIPVTEDAPPKGTICLWCNKQGSVFTSEITYRSECSSYVGKHGYFSNGLENHGDIIAWQPLPEPYKETRGSENDI